MRAAFDLSNQAAIASLGRYELAGGRNQPFETLSGGQQARLRILLLELSGATMLLLDEPTDNLDVESAEALEAGLGTFEGTVLAATHDRYFARIFERFILFRADGRVLESDEPIWSESDLAVRGPVAPTGRSWRRRPPDCAGGNLAESGGRRSSSTAAGAALPRPLSGTGLSHAVPGGVHL